MNVHVQLFAAAKDRAGTDIAELQVSDDCTVGDIRSALLAKYSELEPIAAHLLFAVDDAYGTDETAVPSGARLACFPPVSGG